MATDDQHPGMRATTQERPTHGEEGFTASNRIAFPSPRRGPRTRKVYAITQAPSRRATTRRLPSPVTRFIVSRRRKCLHCIVRSPYPSTGRRDNTREKKTCTCRQVKVQTLALLPRMMETLLQFKIIFCTSQVRNTKQNDTPRCGRFPKCERSITKKSAKTIRLRFHTSCI